MNEKDLREKKVKEEGKGNVGVYELSGIDLPIEAIMVVCFGVSIKVIRVTVEEIYNHPW